MKIKEVDLFQLIKEPINVRILIFVASLIIVFLKIFFCIPENLFYGSLIVCILSFISLLYNPIGKFIWYKYIKKDKFKSFGNGNIKCDFKEFQIKNRSLQMKQDRRRLADWHRNNQEKFAELFGEQLRLPKKERTEEFENVDNARHRIITFFSEILLCYASSFNKKQIKRLIGGSDIQLLNYIEPLEKQINDAYDDEVFRFFEKLYRMN